MCSKKLTKKIRYGYRRLLYIVFLNKPSATISADILVHPKTSSIDIVTIAFNNAEVLRYQVALLRKNIADHFTHIIADNSTDSSMSRAIAAECELLGVHYVRIPAHRYVSNESHAVAMHWVYKNIIRKRNSTYFGFLDHDIFPVRRCSIILKLDKNVYGRLITPDYLPVEQQNAAVNIYWSIWAGFFFAESSLFKQCNVYKLDFFPRRTEFGQLDTGGGLWDSVFKHLSFPGQLATYRYEKFRDSSDSNIHTDYYECIDDWIHIGNLSNWYPTPDFHDKVDYFQKLLLELSDQHDV